MANIELVIKLDGDITQRLCDGNDNATRNIIRNFQATIAYAIKNGIPLPKGHGRLLDEKDILDIENNDGRWYDLTDMPEYIADVKAIVEADTESDGEEQEPCGDACDTCEHADEIDGSNCYECVKGMRNNYNSQERTGHWTHDGSHWENRFICSECGYKLFDEPTNYCPNCGARMESEGVKNEA